MPQVETEARQALRLMLAKLLAEGSTRADVAAECDALLADLEVQRGERGDGFLQAEIDRVVRQGGRSS